MSYLSSFGLTEHFRICNGYKNRRTTLENIQDNIRAVERAQRSDDLLVKKIVSPQSAILPMFLTLTSEAYRGRLDHKAVNAFVDFIRAAQLDSPLKAHYLREAKTLEPRSRSVNDERAAAIGNAPELWMNGY